MSELAKVFALNRKGLNVPRALMITGVVMIPVIVLIVIDEERYALSVIFAMLFAALSDLGGDYATRITRLAEFGRAC